MSYIYIYGLGFCEKPELCEHVFVYYLSLSLPSNPSDHYEWGFCQVICGTHNPSAKSFLGIVFHKLLFIVLVSLLARFSFWWRHLWPTSLNTPLQKEKFVPKKPLSFYFHWVFVFSIIISIVQGSESMVACFDSWQVHAIFYSNLPYWVLLEYIKDKIVSNLLYLGANGTSYPCSWYVLVV